MTTVFHAIHIFRYLYATLCVWLFGEGWKKTMEIKKNENKRVKTCYLSWRKKKVFHKLYETLIGFSTIWHFFWIFVSRAVCVYRSSIWIFILLCCYNCEFKCNKKLQFWMIVTEWSVVLDCFMLFGFFNYIYKLQSFSHFGNSSFQRFLKFCFSLKTLPSSSCFRENLWQIVNQLLLLFLQNMLQKNVKLRMTRFGVENFSQFFFLTIFCWYLSMKVNK